MIRLFNSSKLNVKLLLVVFSIFMFSSNIFAQTQTNIQPTNTSNSSEEIVPDEIIIQFKSSVANSVQSAVSRNSSQTGLPEIDKLNRKYGVSKIIKAFQFKENASNARQQAADKFGLSRTFILKVENNINIEALLKEYNANEDVQYAEPNGLVQAHDIPSSDPLYAQQWGLKNTGQAVSYSGPLVGTPGVDINIEPAWGLHTGSNSITIAIIDTGVNYNHPEFAGRMVSGYDFINNDADPIDDEGHGTACAGIAAASGNNGIGVAGVNWNALIMPVKVLGASGSGSNTAVSNGIVWAADNGADVLSMSLGGGGGVTMQNAVNYAHSLGTIIVASRGNNNNTNASYPASFTNVIAIGALSPCNERKSPSSCDGETWWGSSYGADLDVMAPGARIHTTSVSGGYFATMNGTSAAAPFVAGVAALVRSYAPTLTNDEIRDIIQTTATDIGTPGFDIETGYGRVNAYAALDFASNATPPEVSVTPVNLSFTLDPDQTDNDTFTINNVGGANALGLFWDIVESPSSSWLTVDKSSGKIANGANELITVSINTTGLINGSYQCTLQVNSNDPNNPVMEVIVDLTVNYLPPPEVNITPISLTYSVDIGESITDELTVANVAPTGNLNLHWSAAIQGSLPGLSLNVTSGTASPGTNNNVQININAAGVSDGVYTGSIDFTTNDPSNQLVSVPVELTVVYTPVGSDKLYVFNGSNPASIIRADLDGQNASQPFVGLGRPIDGAVDMVNRKLYYADWSPDFGVYRVDLNGANKEKLFSYSGPYNTIGAIGLDVPNNHMYFAQQIPGSTYRISRANLDGSNIVTLADIPSWGISGITIVPSQGKIYWANRYDTDHAAGTGIWRANLDLTGQEKLTSGGLTARGLSLDVANNEMYWYELRDLGGYNYLNVIRKATMDGLNGVDILNVSAGDVALDPVGGKIYWTEQGGSYPNLTYDTYRANLDGTNTEALGLWGYRLAIDFTPPDMEPPTITCPTDIVVNNDLGQCGAVVNFQVDFDDNLPGTTIDLSSASGSFFDVGTTTVTATATDAAGNQAQCTFDVTVKDTEPPVLEVQDVTYSLDATGNFILYYGSIVQDIVVKNEDNCGIVQGQAGIGISKYLFDCNDIGDNIISVQNNDINGNHSSKEITITITDPLGVCCAGPTAICQDVTIQLDANGNASTTAAAVNNGSTADCGLQSMTLSKTDFTCADIGNNTVTLTVTDVNGAVSTCTATVKVEDNTNPIVTCQEFTETFSGCADFISANTPSGDWFAIGADGKISTAVGGSFVSELDLSNCISDNCTDLKDLEYTLHSSYEENRVSGCSVDIINEYIVRDASGNIADNRFVFRGTIKDTEKPVVTCQEFTETFSGCPDSIFPNTPNGQWIAIGADGKISTAVGGSFVSVLDLSNCISDNCTNLEDLEVSLHSSYEENRISSSSVDIINEYNVRDACGNVADARIIFRGTIKDNEPPVAECKDITVQLDANGNASITASDINNGSTDNCGIASLSIDKNTFDCSDISSGDQVWINEFHYDNTGGDTGEFIEVAGTAGVNLSGYSLVLYNGANGNKYGTVALSGTIPDEGSGFGALSFSKPGIQNGGPDGIVLYDGTSVLEFISYEGDFTANDDVAAGMTSRDVGVSEPSSTPVGNSLQRTGNGSSSWTGPSAESPDSLNAGQNITSGVAVTLTVTDTNGNQSSCVATVTVEDNVAPAAECKDITVQLDANGNATITANDIDNGSNDACGIASLSINKNTFDCSNVGNNTVTLTVTDNNGNTSQCNATVKVEDNVAPTAVCKDVTVQLDANGNASITPSDVDGGSTDACGIASLSIDKNSFDCSNVGNNTVTLTVTDNNGNTSQCTATVKVEDNVAPVALCKAVTIKLDDNGNGSITAQDIDNGSNDACGIASLSLNKTAFDCGDLGDNTVTLTVTDNNGNQSTCTATVTVLDNIPPILTVPKDEVAECDKVPAVGIATATDNCDTNVDIVYDGEQREDGDCINNYTLTRTWTATDDSGNSTTSSQTIIVQDTTAPTVTSNINSSFDLGCNIDESTIPDPQIHIDNGDITGRDNCEGDVKIALDRTEYIENDCKHYVIYYYKAIDVCGNETAVENMSTITYFWQEDDIRACSPSYARYKDSNIYFGEDAELNSNDTGWTNHFDKPGEYTLSLFASVTDYDTFGDKSGEVTVIYTGETVTLEYNLYEPYVMSEASIYIGCEKYPTDDKGDFTTDSSYFNINTGSLDHVRNYTVGPIKLLNTEEIYLITNPITCLQKCDCSKSADEGGTYIPDNDTVFCKKGDVLSNGKGFNSAAFKAYPIPFENEVFLEYLFNYDTNVTIEVFDLKGSLINRTIDSNYSSGVKSTTKLNMKGLSDEMYFVRLTTNRGTGIKKIISQ